MSVPKSLFFSSLPVEDEGEDSASISLSQAIGRRAILLENSIPFSEDGTQEVCCASQPKKVGLFAEKDVNLMSGLSKRGEKPTWVPAVVSRSPPPPQRAAVEPTYPIWQTQEEETTEPKKVVVEVGENPSQISPQRSSRRVSPPQREASEPLRAPSSCLKSPPSEVAPEGVSSSDALTSSALPWADGERSAVLVERSRSAEVTGEGKEEERWCPSGAEPQPAGPACREDASAEEALPAASRVSMEVEALLRRANAEVDRVRLTLLRSSSCPPPVVHAGEELEAEKEEGKPFSLETMRSPLVLRALLAELPRALALYDPAHTTYVPMGVLLSAVLKIMVQREGQKEEEEIEEPAAWYPLTSRKRSRPPSSESPPLRGTRRSPTRTLEQLPSYQKQQTLQHRLEPLLEMLSKLFLEAFGRLYAWKRMGVTNISRHDARVGVSLQQWTALNGGGVREREEGNKHGSFLSVFPELGQIYGEGRGKQTSADRLGFSTRPPPLDALVHYTQFLESVETICLHEEEA